MSELSHLRLGRRERQIIEIVYQRGQASVAQVIEQMSDPPSYTSVRTMLRLLEGKGYLRHKEKGRRFVYIPVVTPGTAGRSALRNLLTTFFSNSVEKAVASLLELERGKLSSDDLDRLAELVEKARKEGR